VRRWDGLELEEAANRAGLQATIVRTVEEFMAEEQFRYLAAMDLVEIKKIADSDPISFTPTPKSPLEGVSLRALHRRFRRRNGHQSDARYRRNP
jgi:hypothetical protein